MTDIRSAEYNDKRDEVPAPAAEKRRPASAVLEPNEARAGATHYNMRYVLVISTVTLAIIFAALWFFLVPHTSSMAPAGNSPDAAAVPSEPATPPGAGPPAGPPPQGPGAGTIRPD